MILIPATTIPPFSQTTTIDGTPYVLDFGYNWRENTWNISISLPNGTILCTGIKLVSNYPLLQKYADARVPQGELYCISQTTDDSPPQYADLVPGGRCILVYLSKSELAATVDPWRL